MEKKKTESELSADNAASKQAGSAIQPAGSGVQPTTATPQPIAAVRESGPEDWFTGKVQVDRLFQPTAPARVAASRVTFQPGARTAWHTHPLGQTLIVIEGSGLAQCEGQPMVSINPGDVIWIPPGERHWHGASPKSEMTHVAIHEQLNGKAVDWLEKVTDEEYKGG